MHLILIVGIKYNIILKMTIHNISQAVFIRRLLNIFLCMSQIGSNAVYILFVAQNILPVIWRLFCPEYLVGDRNILVQNILLIITIYPCSLTQSEITLFKDCGIPPWSRLELPDLHRPSHYSCARHMQVILRFQKGIFQHSCLQNDFLSQHPQPALPLSLLRPRKHLWVCRSRCYCLLHLWHAATKVWYWSWWYWWWW